MNQQTKNLLIEKDGIALVRKDYPNLVVPNAKEKKELLMKVGSNPTFWKSFDAILLHVPTIADIKTIVDFTFVEFKTSAKERPQWPKGYWTGLTENERALATAYSGNYRFCLANVHPKTTQYFFCSIQELDALVKRVRMVEHLSF